MDSFGTKTPTLVALVSPLAKSVQVLWLRTVLSASHPFSLRLMVFHAPLLARAQAYTRRIRLIASGATTVAEAAPEEAITSVLLARRPIDTS